MLGLGARSPLEVPNPPISPRIRRYSALQPANYCGIGTDFIDFTVDLNPVKQGRFLPGSRIPVLVPEAIAEERPDIVVILPWNLRTEVMNQLSLIRDWGGRFAARSPDMRLFE